MADFNALEALINAHIKKNGVQAITGNILNGILRGMVSALGKGYTIAGSASPATDPGTMTGPLAYIAYTAGTYTHFGGLEVEQGEVAMLIYNEAEWHKEVLFSLAASATIDGNVGTPEVGVSFVDGLLTFDFRNMKGNPGNDGDAAGFGTISATVDGNVGTPGVSVQSSGPDTAKNITFQFTNLKGETGVTSVVATVDNTVGTPTCTVSLVGQQLTLAFSGLKGAQGDTGSSVDYPFTIVNNLTTNDATQALSAAMGVELAGQVSQLEQEVNENTDAINGTITVVRSTNLLNPAACVLGYINKDTGEVGATDARYVSDFIPVSENGLYCNAYNGYGASGRAAVYDASKNYLRALESSSYTYQSGDGFVRWTLDKTKVETPTAFIKDGYAAADEWPAYFSPLYYIKDEAIPDVQTVKANVSNLEDKVTIDEQKAFGHLFSSSDYAGFYCSGYWTGVISVSDSHSNGYLIPVIPGETYILHSNELKYTPEERSLVFYSGTPGTDTYIGFSSLDDGRFVVPADAKYLLICIDPSLSGSTKISGYNVISEDSLPVSLYDEIWGIHLSGSHTFTGTMQNYKMFDVEIRAGETFKFKAAADFDFGRVGFYTNATWGGADTHDYLVNGEEYVWTANSDINSVYLFLLSGSYGEITAKLDIDGVADKTNSEYLPALSLCGKDCIKATAASIAASGSLQITNFPQYLKGNGVVSFFAKLTSFNDISVGFGTSTNSIQVKVDGANIYFIKSGSQVGSAVAHGLTISDFIDITFDNDFFAPKVVVASASGLFVHDSGEFPSLESYGYPVAVMGTGTAVTDAELRATSDKFNKPIWVVGDSYTSFYDERWTKQMVKTIGVDKFLVIGLAGGGSSGIYADLQKALAFGTPKFLLWCLGMNDDAEGWGAVFDNLKTLCASMGTELILQTIPIPNLETSSNQEAINTAIKASGYRYIDACAAMCPNNTWPWYDGYCADGVHPTVLGAKVLAARFLSDFPEFLQ